MTDNQRMAIDELTLYREAKKDIENTKQKIEMLETKCNRMTRAPESIMQQTWVNGEFVAVPVVIQRSSENSREELIDALMDTRTLYWQKCTEAEKICFRIENLIFDRCPGAYGRILSMLFIHNKSLEWISVQENYSFRQTLRKKWRALEQYGEKMAHDVTLT